MRSPAVPRLGAVLLALSTAAPALAQRPDGGHVRMAEHISSEITSPQQRTHAPHLQRLVTVDLVDLPLGQALEEIAGEAGLTLGYVPEILPTGARVSLEAQNRRVGELLGAAVAGTGLQIRVVRDGQITVVRRPSPGTEPARAGAITGRVTSSETGAGLPGASVRVEGMRKGTLSGDDGSYRLDDVPPGQHSLVASLIGYSPQSQSVELLAGQTATANFELAVSAVRLDQVVVTGTIVPTEVRAIPTPVTVITADEIERLNIRRVDQLFQGLIPGIISPEPGPVDWASEIHVRGKSTLGSTSIKTYIDGVEVTDHRFIATIDPNSIERIELVRGPQASTIYGPEAINGVLQIITKKGVVGSRPALTATLSVGSMESDYASGPTLRNNHSVGLTGGGENFSYNLASSFQSAGEWVPAYSTSNPSLSAGARLRQGPLGIEFSTRFMKKSFDSPWNPILRDAGYEPWARPPNQRNELQQQTHGLRLTYAAFPRWEHQLTIGQDATESVTYQTAPRLRTPSDTLLSVQDSKGGRVTISYNSTLQVDLGRAVASTVTAGLDHSMHNISSFSQASTSRTDGFLDGRTAFASRTPASNTGVFTQVQLTVLDDLHLTGGVRRDESSNFGDEIGAVVSPRIGASFLRQLGGLTVKVRTAYGAAIRPPALGHSQGAATPTVVVLPNPEIAPERQRGWDAGLDLFFERGGFISLTRYDQRAVDLIETVLLDASAQPRLYQSQNIGEIRNQGWELEAGAELGRLHVGGSYSLTRSTVERLSPSYAGTQVEGEQLFGVPERVMGIQATFSADARTQITANLSHRRDWRELDWLSYYAWRYGGEDYRGSLRAYMQDYPAATRISIGGSREITSLLGVFVQIDNLTNNVRSQSDNLSPVMGRTVWLGARLAR